MTDRRRIKRYLNHLASKLKYGDYFEDCNYHPSVVTYRSHYTDDIFGWGIEGTSLVTGSGTACSLYHWAPWPLTKAQAERRAAYLKQEGHTYVDKAYADILAEEDYTYLTKLARRARICE